MFNKGVAWGKSALSNLLSFSNLFHTLGLKIIILIWRNFRKPFALEQPKAVLTTSFRTALARCSIHLAPVAIQASLLYVNLGGGLYIGPGLDSPAKDPIFLALFQVAAKILETLCVASLGAVVLGAFRHELIHEGVPIGLLGSPIWFSNISCFWSAEFLTSIPHFFESWQSMLFWRFWRKLGFFMLLVLVIAISAVIGPSSAVLLLPRDQTMPAGGTTYFLNGTVGQFWPSVIDASSESSLCSLENATEYAICPGGGHESWHSTFVQTLDYSSFCNFAGDLYAPQCQLKYDPDGYTVLIKSRQTKVPPLVSQFQIRGTNFETSAMQPHAATAIMQQQLIRDWYTATASSPKSKNPLRWGFRTIASGTSINPWVRTRCTLAQNLTSSAATAEFHLSRLTGDNGGSAGYYAWSNEPVPINISTLDRNKTSQIRAQWFGLPTQNSDSPSKMFTPTGLLIELPWLDNSRVAIGCSVAAAWRNGSLSADSFSAHGAWGINLPMVNARDHARGSSSYKSRDQQITLTKAWLDLLTGSNFDSRNLDTTPKLGRLGQTLTEAGFSTISDALRSSPQPLYHVNCEMSMMNPNLTDTELWNSNDCGKGSKFLFLEVSIASLIADGLSRYGSHRVYQSIPSSGDWTLQDLGRKNDFNQALLGKNRDAIQLPDDQSLVTQTFKIQVAGYAYHASTTTDFLAAAVVIVYICLACAHVAWVLWYRVSSSCWDSVIELLALCLNTVPPAALENTSAGINKLGTYGAVARLRVEKEHGMREPRLNVVIEASSATSVTATSNIDGGDKGQFSSGRVKIDQVYR
jgi:hypothetical protein